VLETVGLSKKLVATNVAMITLRIKPERYVIVDIESLLATVGVKLGRFCRTRLLNIDHIAIQ